MEAERTKRILNSRRSTNVSYVIQNASQDSFRGKRYGGTFKSSLVSMNFESLCNAIGGSDQGWTKENHISEFKMAVSTQMRFYEVYEGCRINTEAEPS